MKNAMSLKEIVKNIAKEKKISAQLVLQNYMMERFLERMSLSEFRDKFIVKGGLLIASIVGLDSRATMDIDATVKNYKISEDTIKEMIQEICNIDIDDDITFEFKSIYEIRENDDYTGYRVAIVAIYHPMAVPLKLDITTGDKITPGEIEYKYKLLMEDRSINILAYNLETILAEKLETVISRGEQNTRPRDYYDVYILSKLRNSEINYNLLKVALKATSEKRGSFEVLKKYNNILKNVKNSMFMKEMWENYRKDYNYAKELDFFEVCDGILELLDALRL